MTRRILPSGTSDSVELRFPYGIPVDMLVRSRDDKELRRLITDALSAELEFKARYPAWLRGVAWWWHSVPLWERICAIVFAPVLVPVGLAIVLIPLWLVIAIIWVIVVVIA